PGAGWLIHPGAKQNRTSPVGFGGAHGVCYYTLDSVSTNGFFSADTRLASFDNVTGKVYASTGTTPATCGGNGWGLVEGGREPDRRLELGVLSNDRADRWPAHQLQRQPPGNDGLGRAVELHGLRQAGNHRGVNDGSGRLCRRAGLRYAPGAVSGRGAGVWVE